MFRRKYLFIIFIIFIGLTVYFLVTKIKTQAPIDVSATNPKSVNQYTSSESLIDEKNHSQLKQNYLKGLVALRLTKLIK